MQKPVTYLKNFKNQRACARPSSSSLLAFLAFFSLSLVLSASFASANPSPNTCGTLDADFTITANVVTTGTCFTIGAHNVTLECNGNTITYHNAAGATSYYGIYDSGYDNLTVKNCRITQGVTGGASHGIYVYNDADNTTFRNVTVTSLSGSAAYVYLDSDNATIDVSTLTTNVAATYYSIYVYDSDYFKLTNSTVTAPSFGAVYLEHYVSNALIENNSITGGGVAVGNYGIIGTDEVDYLTARNNRVNAYTYAFYLGTNSDYAVVANNNLTSRTDVSTYLTTYAANNVFENNTIVSGTSNDYGVFMTGSCNNNNFTNNTITATGYDAVYATTFSSNVKFYNNTLTATRYGFQIATTCSNWNVTQNILLTASNAFYFAGAGNNNWVVESNNFTSTGAYGISIIAESSNVNFTNNNVTAQTYGVNLATTSGFRFENNTIRSTTSYGAYLSDANVNTFVNNAIISGSGAVYAVALVASSDNNDFYNNTINGTADAAVYVTASTGNDFYYNQINGIANAAEGIYLTTSANSNNFYYNNVTVWGAASTAQGVYIVNSNSNRFQNCTVNGGTYIGIMITGTSQYNIFDNVTTYVTVVGGDQALYLDTASSNNFTNSYFTSYASQGVYLYNYAQSNYFENVSISSLTSYGVYVYSSATSNSFNNATILSNTSYAVYLFTTASANYFRNINITSTTSYGAYLNTNADNNVFDSGTIRSQDADAVYSSGSSDGNRFYNLNIIAGTGTGDYGLELYTNADNTWFVNSTVTASGDDDAILNGDSDVVFVNVTFDPFDVTFSDALSSLNVSWWVRARTVNSLGYAIEEASVTAKDSNELTIYSGTTRANGYSPYFAATAYIRTSAGSTSYTPTNVTASISSDAGYTRQTISDNTDVTVTLANSDACGSISTDTTLRNNVYAGGTCFTIATNGITLDCNGYTINYSRRSEGYGINVTAKNNAVIKNCAIKQDALNSSSHAVFMSNADNNTVWNSTITTRDAKDFFFTSDADDFVVSTSFNKTRVQFNDTLSSFNVSWYLNASVTTLASAPVENARLLAYDAFSNLVFNETTNANGSTPTRILTEYVQNSTSTTYYTNYLLNASKGSTYNSTSLNLTANASVPVRLNATICGSLSSNYVLTNDVEASGTCFTFAANSVTLNCNGYSVNYSYASAGTAANATGRTGAKLKNCRIIQGSGRANSPAAFFWSANNSLIENSTVTANGSNDYYFAQSHNNALLNSTYNDSNVFIDSSSSNLSVYWFVTANVIGLANEIVENAPVTVLNETGSTVLSGLTNSNGSVFAAILAWVKENASIANATPHNFTATHPETNYATSTNYSIDSSKNLTITVVSASVNITAPYSGQIYFQGQTVPIYVNETKGTTWITNVTVTVLGDDLNREWQATEVSSGYWNYNYSIDPAMTSRTLTIHARGYNGSTYVNQNSTFIVTRSTGGGIEQPRITFLCANHTYLVKNEKTTINATADLDTVIYAMTVNVTYPDNSSAVLTENSTSYNETTYVYSYAYDFNATQNGTYVINASARDVNDNVVSALAYVYAVNAADNVSFNGSGVTTYYLRDVCSDASIATGAGEINASLPAGVYKIVGETSAPRITLFNASVNSSVSGEVLSYSAPGLSSVTPPTNRRNVAVFQVSANASYQLAGVYYNYTEIEGSLVAEASLEMRKCESVSNCNWTSVDYTLNTATNEINGSNDTLSIWAVFEPAYVEPQNNTEYVYITETVVRAAAVTNEVKVPVEVQVPVYVPTEVPKYVSINIIENPGAVEIYSEDSKTIQVKLRNNEAFPLEGITMSAELNAPGVTPSFENPSVGSLAPGEEKTVSLRFLAQSAQEGSYTATVKAFIASKNVEDSANFPVSVMKYLTVDKTAAQETLNFARDLLKENPECAELSGNIDVAQRQLDDGDVGGATDRGKKIIEACKSTLNLLGEEKTKPITGLVAANALESRSTTSEFIMIGVGMAVALTAVFIYNFYQKRRRRGLNS